uniref:Alpha/beta hydrolase n=1 Tax=Neobacillus citreus TaxID=2833578 RepID=A0A942T227_9BACI
MSVGPVLVFLHGVGTGDVEDEWQVALSGALVRLGYPALGSDRWIAPKYAFALHNGDGKHRVPPITVKQPGKDEARGNRREFERRTSAMEYRLGQHEDVSNWPVANTIVDVAFETNPFKQAHNYLHDEQARARVLTRVLDALPETGDLLIVGHSLGSVVAADLLRRLPATLNVIGMITIGSPLASGAVQATDLRETMQEPPVNLGWWINFWNGYDPVAAHRGLSSVMPWLLDLRVTTPPSPRVHNAVEYLSDARVAEAIGYAVYGSLSKDLVHTSNALEVPLDADERVVLLALRYAHLVGTHLKDDLQDRFLGALRVTQATAVEAMLQRRDGEGRPRPESIAHLSFDLADAAAEAVPPAPGMYLSKEKALVQLIVLASDNFLRPFDINFSEAVKRQAMRDLTAELGLGSVLGGDVLDAVDRAEKVLAGNKGPNWIKIGALGAGAVAIVVATGGLALAAGAGLAGAAAVTSALAAFGPGGMIGGLITAGSLVTAGGGGIAFGLANAGTSSEAVESIVMRQLAAVILRQKLDLAQDPAVWHLLVETERQVRRAHERLDEYSDPKSPVLVELRKKIQIVERALEFMREQGLEPERQWQPSAAAR